MSLGVVLAGGRSRRMGEDKAWRDAAGRPALRRVVEALRAAELEAPVVARPGQALPPLPREGVRVVRDPPARRGAGPLAALSSAAEAAGAHEAALVVACDAIALHPDDARTLLDERARGRADVAVALDAAGRRQPLVAAYLLAPTRARLRVLEASGERRLGALLEGLRARDVPAAALVEPLVTAPCNTPPQWREVCGRLGDWARARAGPGL